MAAPMDASSPPPLPPTDANSDAGPATDILDREETSSSKVYDLVSTPISAPVQQPIAAQDASITDNPSIRSRKPGGRIYEGKATVVELTVDNAVRAACINLLERPWFDPVILFVILVNTVFIAWDDPQEDHSKWKTDTLYWGEVSFLAVFTVEMVIKIIAEGFISNGQHSYLLSNWNRLDFVVVVSAFVTLGIDSQSVVSAFRVVRLLRPLRTFQGNKSLRIMASTLLAALPHMTEVILLMTIMFWLFALVGMQFFSGAFDQRCFDETVVNGTVTGYTLVDQPDLCSTLPSGFGCASGQACLSTGRNPNNGNTGYDNIGLSLLTVVTCVSKEGWAEIMYDTVESVSYWSIIYYVCLIVFGALFVAELVVAVIYNAYITTKMRIEADEELRNQAESSKVPPSSSVPASTPSAGSAPTAAATPTAKDSPHIHSREFYTQETLSRKYASAALERRFSRALEQITALRQYMLVRKDHVNAIIRRCYAVSRSRKFDMIVMSLIVANTILLASDHYDQPDSWTDAIFIGNRIFNVIFTVELVIKVVGLGPWGYWQDSFNRFDALVVILSWLEDILFFLPNTSTRILGGLRVVRLLRLFKLAGQWEKMRHLLATIFQALASISSFIVLLFIFVLILAILARQLFANRLLADDGSSARANFDTFGWSLVSIFIVIAGEDWNEVMYNAMTGTSWVASLFFVFVFLFGNFVLLNLFLAVLLSHFDEEKINSAAEALVEDYSDSDSGWFSDSSAVDSDDDDGDNSSGSEHGIDSDVDQGAAVDEKDGGALAAAAVPPSLVHRHSYSTGSKKKPVKDMERAVSLDQVLRSARDEARRLALKKARILARARLKFNNGTWGNQLTVPRRHSHSRHRRNTTSVREKRSLSPSLEDSGGDPEPALQQLTGGLGAFDMPRAHTEDLHSPTSAKALTATVAIATAALPDLPGDDSAPPLPPSDTPRSAGSKRHARRSSKGKHKRNRSRRAVTSPPLSNRKPRSSPGSRPGSRSPSKSKRTPKSRRKRTFTFLKKQREQQLQGKKVLTRAETTPEVVNVVAVGNQPVVARAQTEVPPVDAAAAPAPIGSKEIEMTELGANKAEDREEEPAFAKRSSTQKSRGGGLEKQMNLIIRNEPSKARDHVQFNCNIPTLRLYAGRFVRSATFNGLILVVIVVSTLFLAADDPTRSPNTPKNSFQKFLGVLDIITTSIFAVEAALRIFALGFVMGEHTYLRSGWNVLDFIIVIVSIVALIVDDESGNLSWVKAVRATRALRPLRLLRRVQSLRVVVKSVILALPEMVHVILVSVLLYVIFGVLGVQLMKGLFHQCENPAGVVLALNRTACEAAGLDWTNPRSIGNFDNTGRAMLTLFEMATMELWPKVLFRAVDITSENEAPKRDNEPAFAIFFIVFVIVSNFILVNLFLGAVVDAFTSTWDKMTGSAFLTPKQKMWIEIKRMFLRSRASGQALPPRKGYRFVSMHTREKVFQLVVSREFEIFIVLCIIANMVAISFSYDSQSDAWELGILITNYIFALVFALEAALKITGLGVQQYFKTGWNQFDFVLVVLSIVTFAVFLADSTFTSFDPKVLRIFRLGRLLRLVEHMSGLRRLVQTLYYTLLSVINIGSLLLLFLFVYAVMGMSLFGGIPKGEYLNTHANFDTIGSSMLLLLRMATGEDWNGVMHDVRATSDSVGRALATPYFVSFIIFVMFMMVNLFVAVILDGFDKTLQQDETGKRQPVTLEDLSEFSTKWDALAERTPWWMVWGPRSSEWLNARNLPALLANVSPPLGLKGREFTTNQVVTYMEALNVPVYERTVVRSFEDIAEDERSLARKRSKLTPLAVDAETDIEVQVERRVTALKRIASSHAGRDIDETELIEVQEYYVHYFEAMVAMAYSSFKRRTNPTYRRAMRRLLRSARGGAVLSRQSTMRSVELDTVRDEIDDIPDGIEVVEDLTGALAREYRALAILAKQDVITEQEDVDVGGGWIAGDDRRLKVPTLGSLAPNTAGDGRERTESKLAQYMEEENTRAHGGTAPVAARFVSPTTSLRRGLTKTRRTSWSNVPAKVILTGLSEIGMSDLEVVSESNDHGAPPGNGSTQTGNAVTPITEEKQWEAEPASTPNG